MTLLPSARDMLVAVDNPRYALSLTDQLSQRLTFIEGDGSVGAAELADISPHMGLIESGEFRVGNGVEPGAGFTGGRMGYPFFSYVNDTWLLVGVNNDVLEIGLNATTGKFYFAAGAGILDTAGATFTGLNYFMRFDATNAGVARRWELGTAILSDSTNPVAYATFVDPTGGTELQINGDFELGNLNDFDAVNSATPVWSASTSFPRAGSYSAKLTTTGESEANLQTNGDFELGNLNDWTTGGTGTWAADNTHSHTGTWSAKLTTTASQTGTLTTNLGATPRMAVTAGLYYNVRVWAESVTAAAYTTLQYQVKWYTAASGGSLISTDSFTLVLGVGSFFENIAAVGSVASVLAPATASGAEVVINVVRTAAAGTGVLCVDDIVFAPAQYGTLTTNLGGTPRMATTPGASYAFSSYMRTQNASYTGIIAVWAAYITWYTAASGGSVVSTDTIPYAPGLQSYLNYARTLTAPAGANGATIQILLARGNNFGGTAVAADFYFDDISFKSVTVNNGFYFKDAGPTVYGAPLNFTEQTIPATPASGIIATYANSADHAMHETDSYGADRAMAKTVQSPYVKVTNTVTETTIVSGVVKQNSMGANGVVRLIGEVIVKNNKGSAGTFTLTFYFGTKSFAFLSAAAIANSATTRYAVLFNVTVKNAGATNAQLANAWYVASQDVVADSVIAGAFRDWWSSAAIDTTAADTTFKVTITLSAASTSFFAEASGEMSGPYFG